MIKIEKAIESTAVLTVFLYMLSILRLKMYYNQFGIDIIPLISFAEAAKLMLSGIFMQLFFALVLMLFMISIKDLTSKRIRIFKDLSELNQEFTSLLLYGSFSFAALGFLCLFIYDSVIGLHVFFIMGTVIFLGQTIILILLLSKSKSTNWLLFPNLINDAKVILYGSVLLFLLNLTYVISLAEAWVVKHPQSQQRYISFQFDGKTVTSGSTVLYVGGTEKYVFMHDTKTGQTTAYPYDQIKWMTFHTPIEK